jgi:hypothetical protein
MRWEENRREWKSAWKKEEKKRTVKKRSLSESQQQDY